MKSYSKKVTVSASDLDALEHVNNIRFLEWVQEISKAHWSYLSRDKFEDRFFWVVRSHQITYFKPALLGDELTISTFVPEGKGPLSKRVVEFYVDGPENKIARCETDWILLEYRTGKPCRIPKEIQDLFGY